VPFGEYYWLVILQVKPGFVSPHSSYQSSHAFIMVQHHAEYETALEIMVRFHDK
jgi:hypothetical protein